MPTQIELPDFGVRISRVTIGRLHNLGNYEHSRYEVTVEIPPGKNAGSVMRDVDSMLAAIAPRSPVAAYELARAKTRLTAPVDPGDRLDAGERSRAEQVIALHIEWERDREMAFARFSALGGKEEFVYHKDYSDDQP